MPAVPTTFAFDLDRFRGVVSDPVRWHAITDAADSLARELEGRALWRITATAQGGIGELVRSYVAVCRGIGIDARWEIIDGIPEFFALARRIHNDLHGEPSDTAPYSDEDRLLYEETLRNAARDLAGRISRDDVVILHGTPVAGLAGAVVQAGARPIWRCHVGLDMPNDAARRAWRFLMPYVERADAFVFSRPHFIWEHLDGDRAFVVAPTLDPFSPKNAEMNPAVIDGILEVAGLQQNGRQVDTAFVRLDGSPGRVDRKAELVETAPLPRHVPLVLQVSPWNRLKDPPTVVDVFAQDVPAGLGAHLVIAGPKVGAMPDEPEASEVFAETLARWRALPAEAQERIHLAQIPTEDPDESAAIINALQRRASVVLQKSRGEGFGMTVLEAAWKARPVVASRVGGLQEHVIDGVTGYLIDREGRPDVGNAIAKLLLDRELAQRMGVAGRENVRANYLVPSALPAWAAIIDHVDNGRVRSGHRASAATS